MNVGYDNAYQKLSDDEWHAVSAVITPYLEAANPPNTKKKPRGRPRLHTRMCADAVLCVVTTGLKFRAMEHQPDGEFPSPPTIARFYKELYSAGAFPYIAEALADTRPRLGHQMDCHTAGKPRPRSGPRPGQQTDDNGTWGFILTPLPWGPPGEV